MFNTKKNIINIISNDDIESKETSKSIQKALQCKGYKISNSYDKNSILNICIGGDGAFLRAVHKLNFPTSPFIGINTGHLGFFQEICPNNLDEFINCLTKKDCYIDEFHLVKATVYTNNSQFELTGVNEIVVKEVQSKTIHLHIAIENTYLERFSGDGVIVSTPLGSTAYNFSSGGSLVYPTLSVLQLTPIAPINSKVYRSLTSSVIIPNNMTIKLTPEYRDVNSILIIIDGVQHTYENIVKIELNIPEKKIKMLTLGNRNFWSDIKEKFL